MAAFKRWNQEDQGEALKIEANANKARIPEQIKEVKKKKKVNINKNLMIESTQKSSEKLAPPNLS